MNIISFIISLPTGLWNWFQFRRFLTDFQEFPSIRGLIVTGGRGKLVLGSGVIINSSARSNPVGAAQNTGLHIAPSATITIGSNVGISNTLLYAWQAITIEDEVMIGGGCQVYDTDFHSISYYDRIESGDNNVKSAPVVIRKGAFIGASSIILKGVTIGERSVVAAGAVVTKSIPHDEVWGGNPAKFIRKVET